MQLQQCVASFISDLALLGAAKQPAPVGHQLGFITSLDHSMWFHNPFRIDEWMLCEIESPQCGKRERERERERDFLNGDLYFYTSGFIFIIGFYQSRFKRYSKNWVR